MDHRRFDVATAQEFLDRSDIVAAFEQVTREGIPKRVGGNAFGQPSPMGRLMDRLLNH